MSLLTQPPAPPKKRPTPAKRPSDPKQASTRANSARKRASDKPGSPDEPVADDTLPEARVMLGRALATRSRDIGDFQSVLWRNSTDGTSSWGSVEYERIQRRISDIGAFATTAFSTFLVTGRLPTTDEANTWTAPGAAAMQGIVSLADITDITLNWRRAASAKIDEEAKRLGTDGATIAEVQEYARLACDMTLMGLAKSFDAEQQRLQAEVTASETRLTQQQLHDSLTGLPNRLLVLDRLSHALSTARRHKTSVAVLFVDIDHFKLVNEVAGHSAGDNLLMEVAKRLQRLVRPSDTAARFGGDEFVLLCEDLTEPQAEAVAVAGRVSEALAEPFVVAGRELFASASVGIAIGRSGDDPEALVSQADAATYLAKWRGRACYVLYEPAIDEGSARPRRAGERAAQDPRAWGTGGPLPADQGSAFGEPGEHGSPPALEPSGSGTGGPHRVHPDSRGHRPHRRHRQVGARDGLQRLSRLEGSGQRRRSVRQPLGAPAHQLGPGG